MVELYVFAYLLLRRLPPPERGTLPREMLAQVDLETYQMRQMHNGVNFKFYKLYNDEPQFALFLRDLLFDRYLRAQGEGAERL